MAGLLSGQARLENFGRRALAVARVGGTLRGMEDRCPHQAALLSKGFVKDGHVVCPVHRFHYHATTGACRMDMTGPVAVFPVREADGRVEVGLPAKALRLSGRDMIIWRGKQSRASLREPSAPW